LLLIYSIKDSPRLQYITKILFGVILEIEYSIVIVSEKFDIPKSESNENAVLFYGMSMPAMISIPNEGLLFEDNIRRHEIVLEKSDFYKLRFSSMKSGDYAIDFDLFSSAFYLLTQYEYYHSLSFDLHGRYDEKSSIFYKDALHSEPLVDIYANFLFEKLKLKYPGIQRKKRQFNYKISFDIDSPYLYENKGFILTAGSLIKNILKLKMGALVKQIQTLRGGKDPYDVYDYIIDKVPNDNLIFFFLINRKSPHDGRHTFQNKAYRNLIKKIADTGIETGIHPSYKSFMDADLIRFEKAELESITGKPVISSRMHFLKYRLPETFHNIERSGIKSDYTLCPIHDTGFKTFISMPYTWFDLVQNVETDLTLYPTMVMDRSLQQYMHLTPEKAIMEIKKMIDITFEFNGLFTILFHNNSLSEKAEWKGWKMVFEETMMYLSDKKTIN